MYHQFNIQQLYVLPTQCICFVWISEQTAIISLYSINWLVFITETERVYCAVRTQPSYTKQITLCLKRLCHGSGRQSPASHSGCPGSTPCQSMWNLWCTKWHWDRFFSESFGFLSQYHSTKSSTLIFISVLLIEGQTAEAWEPLRSSALSDIGNHWIIKYVYSASSCGI